MRDIYAHAGQRIDTPCFSVVVGHDGDARVDGCSIDLYDKYVGQDDLLQYFRINVLSDQSPNVDGLVSEELAARAKLTAARPELARHGPYTVAYAGPYLGTSRASVFGLDARILAWGHHTATERIAKIMIFTMLPKNHYDAMGHDVDAIQIQGFPAGRDAAGFIRSLASVRMK